MDWEKNNTNNNNSNKGKEFNLDFPKFTFPKNVLKLAVFGGILLLALIFLTDAAYIINSNEAGIVLRFGKFYEQTGPGLHFKLPSFVDSVIVLPVKNIQKEEFGFKTSEAGIRESYSKEDIGEESIMLTGDLNVADVEWIVQYKISDPKNYLFSCKSPVKTLRDMSESVMRKVIGDKTVNQVLTIGRIEIENEVKEELQQILDKFKLGIQIVTVNLQNVNPPVKVKPSFNDVNKAKQDQEKMINEATREFNQAIPKTQGEAEQLIQQAYGYKFTKVNEAKGDAAKFLKIWKEYRNSKEVTRRRLYLESMTQILKKVKTLYVIDKNQKNVLPLLDPKKLAEVKNETK